MGSSSFLLTQSDVDDLRPLLDGHYPVSSLVRRSPPLTDASVFRPRGSSACVFFLRIAGQVLTFLRRARFVVMPPEYRMPPGRDIGCRQTAPKRGSRPWFWHRLSDFDTSNSGSLTLISTNPTCRIVVRLFLNVHDQGFSPKPLEVVWNPVLSPDSEGPTLISPEAWLLH